MSDTTTTAFGEAAASRVPEHARERGSAIGRYIVIDPIGRGGMGDVYSAWDPRLARRVALKSLHSLRSDAASRWIAREAKALARLSHPHVVQVYELLEHDGEHWIVMELVNGATLKDWQTAETRSWKDIVELFLQAGEALAAAHEAGLVHRDFKPSNVLVEVVRGRPHARVLDFGLANPIRHTDERGSQARVHVGEATQRDAAGTPGFMAPEQLDGDPVTPAADQFGFCVSLWRALYAEAPRVRTKPGRPPTPLPELPHGSKVPAAIGTILIRGLATKPDDRYASMRVLLDALRRELEPKAHARFALAGALVATLLTGWWLYASNEPAGKPCSGAREALGAAWNDERKQAARAALLGGGASYAETTWASVSAMLDAHAEAWVQMHTEACEATVVHGHQSRAVMDLRMECLNTAQRELAAVTDLLVRADDAVVQRAVEIAGGLRPLARCADLERLKNDLDPTDPQTRGEIREIRALLAEANAARTAGHYEASALLLADAKRRTAAVDYGPLRAEVSLGEGRRFLSTGDHESAETALREALGHAAEWKRWDELQQAAVALMGLVGGARGQPDAGLRYRELAERGLSDWPGREGEFRHGLGGILATEGDYSGAETELRRSIDLLMADFGADDLRVTTVRNNLAIVLARQGRLAEAEAEHRRVLAQRERMLGPSHPLSTSSKTNLALALSDQGKDAEAEALIIAALQTKDELGEHNPLLGSLHGALGNVLYARRDYPGAEVAYRAALEVLSKRLGPEHPQTVMMRASIARAVGEQDRVAEAELLMREALTTLERTVGTDHPQYAEVQQHLATLLNAAPSKHR